MDLLTYLFIVATDPYARPEGGIARWPVVVWTYRVTFGALVLRPNTTLTFKDVDAWTSCPGVPTEPKAFVGDCQDMAVRMVAMDPKLAEVLRPGNKPHAGDTYAVVNPDGVSDTDLAMLSQRISDAGIPDDVDLCDPSVADRVRAVLDAWVDAGPHIARGADRVGSPAGTTITA